MKEIIIYVATDGRKFYNKNEALKYEKSLIGEQEKKVIESINIIKDYCKNTPHCNNCFFKKFCEDTWERGPSDWNVDDNI